MQKVTHPFALVSLIDLFSSISFLIFDHLLNLSTVVICMYARLWEKKCHFKPSPPLSCTAQRKKPDKSHTIYDLRDHFALAKNLQELDICGNKFAVSPQKPLFPENFKRTIFILSHSYDYSHVALTCLCYLSIHFLLLIKSLHWLLLLLSTYLFFSSLSMLFRFFSQHTFDLHPITTF